MIQVQNVSKIYDKRGIAGLHQISFTLKEGEIAALMGPNGSGKSTLLNIIAGKLPPESGAIKINGACALFDPVSAPETGNVQKFLLSSITVTDNEEKKIQLTRDLADIMEFTFQLRQDLADLSAGQKQKVLLASLLINRPSLLLLDEPFTHLDPMTRKVVLNALFDYIKNHSISVLWVTHDLNEAFLYSQKIALLNFGKIEQWGNPEELAFHPKNLFVAQFVGYKNIMAVTYSEGYWQTPWGKWEYPNKLNAVEALMVIPVDAWNFSGENTQNFKLKSSVIKDLSWEVEAQMQEKNFYFQASDKQMKQISQKPSFLAVPEFRECFVIPL